MHKIFTASKEFNCISTVRFKDTLDEERALSTVQNDKRCLKSFGSKHPYIGL
jgi:hypothetical protein